MKTATKVKQKSEVENFKKKFSFKDANHNLVMCEAEITHRNGYPEFSISGDYNNGMGQVFDRVKPDGKTQKKLVDLWKKHHLKKVDIAFRLELIKAINTIEEEQEAERSTQILCRELNDRKDNSYIQRIAEEGIFSNTECAAATGLFFNLTFEELLNEVEESGTQWTIQGQDYLIGDDTEMDIAWEEDLDNYLDECVLPELPDNAQRYFDRDAWMKDAKMDGRGHSLNRYNGSEEEQSFNGTTYYIYRQ